MLDLNVFFAPEDRASRSALLGHGFFIHGARQCGKTSLAFQAAVNCVLEGGRVVVLCQESALYAKMPRPFTPLSELPEDALQRMEFVYVDSWLAAAREIIGMSDAREAPSLVLIDDDGFVEELSSEKHHRGGGSGGAASSGGLPQCLSLLENFIEWLQRCHHAAFYVIVTNASLTDAGGQIGLPYRAFPMIRLCMGSSGAIEVTPTAADRSPVEMLTVGWSGKLDMTVSVARRI